MSDLGQCSESVSRGDGWHKSRCKKMAVAVEGGKPYCKIHLPSVAKARREERNAAWDAKFKADRERYARNAAIAAAREAVVKAALAWFKAQNNPRRFCDGTPDLLYAACAEYAKLEEPDAD